MTWAIHNPDMHKAVIELSKSRSDRIAAVVGGAIIEEALLGALYSRMRRSGVFKLLFDPNRPLGGFAAKLNLAYLLYACDDDTRLAIEGFTEIRNVFAHKLSVTRFTDPDAKLTAAFLKLKLHTLHTHFPAPFWNGLTNDRIPRPRTRRAVFIINMQIILLLLMRDQRMHGHHNNESQPLPLPPKPLPPAYRKKKR